MYCLLNFTIGNSYKQEAHGLFSSLVSWSVFGQQGYFCLLAARVQM